jgi:hypothetical protein
MVTQGPALEKRQGLLFRCVDIGAELFAMAAVCARAQRDLRVDPSNRTPLELADLFCRQSRLKVENLFEGIRANADPEAYRVARGLLDGRYDWLETGIVDAPSSPEPADDRAASAAGN